MHPIYCDIYFVLPSAFDILRYILSCRAIAIYDCNVVCATKETLTICYLDMYCIKMENTLKIAELSLVMNVEGGALGRFDTSTRLTSAPLDGCTTWVVCHH